MPLALPLRACSRSCVRLGRSRRGLICDENAAAAAEEDDEDVHANSVSEEENSRLDPVRNGGRIYVSDDDDDDKVVEDDEEAATCSTAGGNSAASRSRSLKWVDVHILAGSASRPSALSWTHAQSTMSLRIFAVSLARYLELSSTTRGDLGVEGIRGLEGPAANGVVELTAVGACRALIGVDGAERMRADESCW